MQSAQGAGGAYRFEVVAKSGDGIPGGVDDTFGQYFVIGGIDPRGEVAFDNFYQTADIDALFICGRGASRSLMVAGQTAPGGGLYLELDTPAAVDEWGDVSFVSSLNDYTHPVGLGDGVYRYDAWRRTTEALVVPYVTAAPGGGQFQGALNVSMDKLRRTIFQGMISTDKGAHNDKLGLGIFRQNLDGTIVSILSPGDPGPGGDVFDYAGEASGNTRGDTAITAHLSQDRCGVNRPSGIFCHAGVYLKTHDGALRAVAPLDGIAPGGSTYAGCFSPRLNDRGQLVFTCGTEADTGIFLDEGRGVSAIARTGTALPGGNTLSDTNGNISLNERGEVAFIGVLDTSTVNQLDTGVYVWSKGQLHLVARAGTVVPGLGAITGVDTQSAYTGTQINDRGQIAFVAGMSDGSTAVVVATPEGIFE